LLQRETAALLQTERFTTTVDAWILAAGDPLGAAAGVRLLRDWGIDPLAITGVACMSPLGTKEAEAATGLPCMNAKELQCGRLNAQLLKAVPGLVPAAARERGTPQKASGAGASDSP
jgi:hypothetical protein